MGRVMGGSALSGPSFATSLLIEIVPSCPDRDFDPVIFGNKPAPDSISLLMAQ
jgi:hypothetical protein